MKLVCCWLLLSLPAATSEPNPPKLYEGRTLDEWRELFKNLSPSNPASRAAVPGLILILKDRDVPWFTRSQAANTLGRMGKNGQDAVMVLITLLDEPRAKEHSPSVWATKSLALFGPEAQSATPRLVEILKDDQRPLIERLTTLEALGQIGGSHPRAIPALVETLNLAPLGLPDKTQMEFNALRELAIEAIAVVGPDAKSAIPMLLRLINSPSESTRRKSVTALGRMGAAAQLAVPSLMESLAFDESPAVRDAAETAFARIGTSAVPALTHLLGDQDSELRQRAARSLGQMGVPAKPAVGPLKKLFNDPKPEVRLSAAKSVWVITKQAHDSLPVFVEMLKSSDRQLRIQAFRLLTKELGVQATPARPAIAKLLDHSSNAVRQAAKSALERIPHGNSQYPDESFTPSGSMR